MDTAIFISACVANLCVLAVVWIRPYKWIRTIQTLSCFMACVQIAQSYGLIHTKITWNGYDQFSTILDFLMMATLFYAETNLLLGLWYMAVLTVTAYEYGISDGGDFTLANHIYYYRAWMEIAAIFGTVIVVYFRKVGQNERGSNRSLEHSQQS